MATSATTNSTAATAAKVLGSVGRTPGTRNIAIGRTVKNAVRRIDHVFRYGGDEFVVILNETGIDGATEIAERIRKNIERRVFVIKECRIQTTVSIGIATYPDHAADRDTLLRLADEAMYSAKNRTRNAVCLAIDAKLRNVS